MASDPVENVYEGHVKALSPAERLRLMERIARELVAELVTEAHADHGRGAPARRVVGILEDDEARAEAMRAELHSRDPGFEVVTFDNAPDMILWLPDHLPSLALLCLDHDLGPNRQRDGRVFDPATGRVLATVLAPMPPSCPVLIHSSNADAALGMKFCLQDKGWEVERIVPSDGLGWIATHWIAKVVELLPGDGDTEAA